jgi:hypothetical protein
VPYCPAYIWNKFEKNIKMSNDSITTEAAPLQPEPASQQTNAFLAGQHIFNRALSWLVDLTQLTKKEQEQAGIDLSNQGR